MNCANTQGQKYDEMIGIKLTNKALECSWICLGHDKEDWYNKNWMKTYHDTENLFESSKKINSVMKNMHSKYIDYFLIDRYCNNTRFAQWELT